MRQHGNGLLQKQRILIKIIEMVDSGLPLSTESPLWSSFELDLKIKKGNSFLSCLCPEQDLNLHTLTSSST